MAAKSGKMVLRVNPRHTSQECSVCHHIAPDNRKGSKFLCTRCGHIDDANFQAGVNIKNKAISFYQLNITKKVRRDLPKPKQLSLFQTPISELTESKRRYHYARNCKRNEPGNLKELAIQLSLFNQENNHPDRDSL